MLPAQNYEYVPRIVHLSSREQGEASQERNNEGGEMPILRFFRLELGNNELFEISLYLISVKFPLNPFV